MGAVPASHRRRLAVCIAMASIVLGLLAAPQARAIGGRWEPARLTVTGWPQLAGPALPTPDAGDGIGPGSYLLIDQTDGLRTRELLVADGIREQLIDGVIFSPRALGAAELAERVHVDRTPMVLLGERIHGGLADHVAIDNVAAARTAVRHLAEIGRRRIAAIGADRAETSPAAHLRLDGYRLGLRDSDLAVDAALIIPTAELHRVDGAKAMAELLDLARPPDAIFCFNDLVALGALRTLAQRGVRVPDDIAIAGFDDIEDGRFSSPTLTTISPDKEQIARVAVSLLLDRLDERSDAPPQEIRADYRLIPRESTLGPATTLSR